MTNTNGQEKSKSTKTKERPKRAIRTPERREIDRAEMVRLLREGWSKVQIAEHLGVSYHTLLVDWTVVKKELRQSREDDTADIVNCKLEELAYIKRQAWEAWQKSKLPKVRRHEQEKTGPKGTDYVVSQTEEGQCGDNSYLQTIMDCVRMEIELQALNPPKEFKGQMNIVNWDLLAKGIPDGPVPDQVEEEIQKMIGMQDDNTIIIPPTQSSEQTPQQPPQDQPYREPENLEELEGDEE